MELLGHVVLSLLYAALAGVAGYVIGTLLPFLKAHRNEVAFTLFVVVLILLLVPLAM